MKIEGSKAEVSQVEQFCPPFYTFSIPLPEETSVYASFLAKKAKSRIVPISLARTQRKIPQFLPGKEREAHGSYMSKNQKLAVRPDS